MKPNDEQIKKFWEWCGWEKIMEDRPIPSSSGRKCAVYVCDMPPRACENCGTETPTKFRKEERWYSPIKDEIYENIYGHRQSYMPHQLPPTDLNSLFEYAVPKVYEELGIESVTFYYVSGGKSGCHFNDNIRRYTVADNPALALFWAIWKVANPTSEVEG